MRRLPGKKPSVKRADKAARERAAKLDEFKHKEAERLAGRESYTRKRRTRKSFEKTANEKANRTRVLILAL